MVTEKDTSFPLTPDGIKLVQKVIETLILYSRTVNRILLVELGKSGSENYKGT